MGLVEGVIRETAEVIEQLLRRLRRHTVRRGARNKAAAFRLQHRRFFLCHSAAHDVRVPQRIACQNPEYAHDLLLIDRNAEGLCQHRFQQRRRIRDTRRILPVCNIGGNGFHRTGAVQRNRRLNVPDATGAQRGQHLFHAAGLQLEHAGGRAAPQQVVNGGVVQRKTFHGKVRIQLADLYLGIVQDSQVAQGKKVEFQNTQPRHGIHVKLRDHRSAGHCQRHILRHRALRDDHARRVNGYIARHPFQRNSGIHQPPDLFGTVVQCLEIGQAQRLRERNAQLMRHGAGNRIHVTVCHPHGASDIADRRAGSQCTERDDLRDALPPVAARDIVDDLVAAVIAEVHVKVGHTDTLRIEKALEQQFKRDGIHLGDADTVRNQTAGAGAAPRSDGNILRFGEIHVVPDNEVIVIIPHVSDDRQLILQPCAVLLLRVTSGEADLPGCHTPRKARIRQAAQVLPGALSVRAGKAR